MIPLYDIIQGTPQWDFLRIANPGASSFKRIVKSDGEPVKKDVRDKFLDECINEYFRQEKTKTFQSTRMSEGVPNEIYSIRRYELVTGYDTEKVGIVYKDDRRLYHISPDAFIIGEKIGFETKDAQPTIQIARNNYFKKHGKLETQMVQQVQGSLFVTGFERWDWQSFCVTKPAGQIDPLLIQVYPDEKFISKLEEHLENFCRQLWRIIAETKNGK